MHPCMNDIVMAYHTVLYTEAKPSLRINWTKINVAYKVSPLTTVSASF